jgi:eukaryotic-like serine/threonine-protein kinase
MAVVYLARDAALGRQVAIKILAERHGGDPEQRERFLREAQLAARLNHPNVVSVFDAGEEDGQPYIVMECVDGETLADELARRKRFAPAEAVDVALQASAGLAHAHAAGLVHRDVKPGNLLRAADGAIKIVDFGIARAAESTQLTQAGTVLGTVAYLSPEQAAGKPVTAAADIYSLGAVLYELLTGGPPYRFESLAELVVEQRDEPITPIRELAPEVPVSLEDAVMRCLARSPEYRPSAEDLAGELAPAAHDPPTQVLPQLAPRHRRRRPWLALLGAVLLLSAVVGAVLGATSGKPQGPKPTEVQPVPRGSTPSEQARNLADWIQSNSK